jgi:hypothetical protein
MESNTIVQTEAQPKSTLRLFTLYVDFAAGVRAKRAINEIKELAGAEFRVTSEMWKLDSVSPAGPIRRMIAQEAGESDVLIVAASCPSEPDLAFIEWLEFLVNWKANRMFPGLLAGLLGDEEHVVNPMNWMVNELAAFARQTRMHWQWHPGAREAWEGFYWLAGGLREVLDAKRVHLVHGSRVDITQM